MDVDFSEVIAKINETAGFSYGEQYDIVSKVAYLLGVNKRIFENDHEPPKDERGSLRMRELPHFFMAICAQDDL